jgi:hypothetical protein
MVTWEEVYPDSKTREDMQFYNRYLSQEQDKKLREKARMKGLVDIMLRDTEIPE